MKVISRPATTTTVESAPPQLPESEEISVNGVMISRAAISREAQNHPADTPGAAWKAAAQALVVRELLRQEAHRLGIRARPLTDDEGRRETDEDACVRTLIEREAPTPDPDEQTLRRVYDRQRDRFRSEDIFAVRHILFAAAQGEADLRRELRDAAQSVLNALLEDPSSFHTMAVLHSACPSKETGGNLGQISRGQTVPEFERALAELPVGQISEKLVETRYGYHIVCVDKYVTGAQLPFEAVRESISSWLTAKAQHVAIREYITLLAGQATLTGIELEALQ